MNRLVALMMLVTIGALVAQVAEGDAPRWASIASLALTMSAVGLAAGHTFANAGRLAAERGPYEEQVRLARLMLRDHVLCLGAIVTVLALQLAFA